MYHTVLGTVSECAISYLAVMEFTMLGWTASSQVEAYCSHMLLNCSLSIHSLIGTGSTLCCKLLF